ncbi:deoxynucleotide monophosphate kinase family protein [Streptomyces sp. NPDC054950]
MTYQSTALMGKARSGKDTVGKHLVDNYQFTRLAFADPLKRMALDINPWIPTGPGLVVRLEPLIADVGWEYAKEHYPEVRRFLQAQGQTVRENDEDYWVRILMRRVRAAQAWNLPMVVTDMRYENEARVLRDAGFLLVRIERRGLTSSDRHVSENALNGFPADCILRNNGSIADLHALTDLLVRPRD